MPDLFNPKTKAKIALKTRIPENDLERRLTHIFNARLAMTPLANRDPSLARFEKACKIFELQMAAGDRYYFLPNQHGNPVPPADGSFFYAILAHDPGRVYCCAIRLGGKGRSYGHTSLTREADVLYAGDIFLRSGKLESWTNGSGHYKPSQALRHTNLIPAVKRLLPEALFSDYQS
jgi:insecticidal toxin complex protein TccC